MMRRILFSIVLVAAPVVYGIDASAQAGGREGSGAIIEQALGASAKPLQPKKIKTRGHPKVARWEEVDQVLAGLAGRIDAKQLSERLRDFHKKGIAVPRGEEALTAEVESSLSAYTIPFKSLFVLDEAVLFPLTNSVLNYVPDASLTDVPIYNKSGKVLGRFAGKYTHERSGGVTRQTYRLVYFQFLDEAGNNQTTGSDLLLDSYCVRWGDIKDRPGFSLAVLLKDARP